MVGEGGGGCDSEHQYQIRTMKVKEMIPDCSAVDYLSVFPFLDGATLGNLKTELLQYIGRPLKYWTRLLQGAEISN